MRGPILGQGLPNSNKFRFNPIIARSTTRRTEKKEGKGNWRRRRSETYPRTGHRGDTSLNPVFRRTDSPFAVPETSSSTPSLGSRRRVIATMEPSCWSGEEIRCRGTRDLPSSQQLFALTTKCLMYVVKLILYGKLLQSGEETEKDRYTSSIV